MATEKKSLFDLIVYLFVLRPVRGGIHNILWSAKHVKDTVRSSFYEPGYNSGYSSN